MSVYRRQDAGSGWRYDFLYRGRRYVRGGFQSAEEAQAAESVQRAHLLSARPEAVITRLRAKAIVDRTHELARRLSAVLYVGPRHYGCAVDAPQAGFVYVVNAETGLTKIGKAHDPLRRFEQLRTSAPAKLWLLNAAPTNNAPAIEKALHREFAKYRARGEWFGLPGSALNWLCSRGAFFHLPHGGYVDLTHEDAARLETVMDYGQ